MPQPSSTAVEEGLRIGEEVDEEDEVQVQKGLVGSEIHSAKRGVIFQRTVFC